MAAMAFPTNECNAEFQDELALQSLYPEQVTVNATKNQCVIQFICYVDKEYIVLVKFTKAKDSSIHISASNHEKCTERFPRKVLEKLASKLQDICVEEADANPIFQCISYLTDSLLEDLQSLGIELVHHGSGKKKQEQEERKTAEHENEAGGIDRDYANQNKHKKKRQNKKNKAGKQTETNHKQLVTIYTWGNKIRKRAPIDSQHNTNVCGVVGYKPHGVDLKHLNGKDARIQHHVANGRNYDLYAGNLKRKIMDEGLRTISINCHKGRHRSVAFAELLAKDLRQSYGYQVKLIHLEIS